MNRRVRVYSTPYCGYCLRAKALLNKRQIAFEEIDVSGDGEARAWLARTTGQRTVPQIFIDEQSIGGFAELDSLDRRGLLQPMFASEPSPA